MGGFDLVPAVLDRIKEGYVQATVDQQPYLQGYLHLIGRVWLPKRGDRSTAPSSNQHDQLPSEVVNEIAL